MKTQPPSVHAVLAFLNNEPGSFEKVVRTFVERSLLLTAGFHFLSKQPNALKLGFTGSAVIEAYLFWYFTRGQK